MSGSARARCRSKPTKRANGLNFENSEWNLSGSVQIHVPDGRLSSGEAEVTFRNNEISRAVIRGQPASFEQRLKEQQKLARGRASSIEYDARRHGTPER